MLRIPCWRVRPPRRVPCWSSFKSLQVSLRVSIRATLPSGFLFHMLNDCFRVIVKLSSGKSKRGLSKRGLGPKGAIGPDRPRKRSIGPEKAPIPKKARFSRAEFPPICSENLGLKAEAPVCEPPFGFSKCLQTHLSSASLLSDLSCSKDLRPSVPRQVGTSTFVVTCPRLHFAFASLRTFSV